MNGMSVTVIRGTGACDVFVNDILQEEFKRQNEMWAKEMTIVKAELQATKGHLNKELAKKLEKVKKITDEVQASRNSIKEYVIWIWGTIYYYSEKWGLVKYEG